jgi:hypothetical protein
MLSDPKICWRVAESGGEIAATAAAIRNIGGEADRIAEGFGLVVAPALHKRSVGSLLWQSICKELASTVDFFIAEVRTNKLAPWRVVQGAGFCPIGFQACGQRVGDDFENTLFTARVSDQIRAAAALANDDARATYPDALHLANAVLSLFEMPNIRSSPAHPYDVAYDAVTDINPRGKSCKVSVPAFARDDERGRCFLGDWPRDRLHESGVICLNELTGIDRRRSRFEACYYTLGRNGQVQGAARVIEDKRRSQFRITQLNVVEDGLQGPLLAGIVGFVTARSTVSMVVDVLAANRRLLATLFGLGFKGTVYYPFLVAGPCERHDGLRMTLWQGLRYPEPTVLKLQPEWDSMFRPIVETVLEGSGVDLERSSDQCPVSVRSVSGRHSPLPK